MGGWRILRVRSGWGRGYFFEGGEVEVVAELQVDVFAMLGVFWIGEGVRGEEGAIHECLGDATEGHVGL